MAARVQRLITPALAALAGLWLSQPGLAHACSVCFSAKNKENQIAYLATTGFLTFLPLALIGGLLLWIRKRSRELDAESPVVEPGQGRLQAVPSAVQSEE